MGLDYSELVLVYLLFLCPLLCEAGKYIPTVGQSMCGATVYELGDAEDVSISV